MIQPTDRPQTYKAASSGSAWGKPSLHLQVRTTLTVIARNMWEAMHHVSWYLCEYIFDATCPTHDNTSLLELGVNIPMQSCHTCL